MIYAAAYCGVNTLCMLDMLWLVILSGSSTDILLCIKKERPCVVPSPIFFLMGLGRQYFGLSCLTMPLDVAYICREKLHPGVKQFVGKCSCFVPSGQNKDLRCECNIWLIA